MNDRPRHILLLNIRSTSPYYVRKKQRTSAVGGKKNYITVNKERNKISKGSCAVSKKDNKFFLKYPSQHQVGCMNLLLQMVNRHKNGIDVKYFLKVYYY